LKGGQGESERAGEKEIKRRRERGKGAVGSSNRQWQDQEKCSKDVSLFKVDRKNAPRTCPCLRWISHKWDKAAHLYQSLLSFLA